MTAPNWATAIPNDPSIHVMPTLPGEDGGIQLPQFQLIEFVSKIIEGVVREIVLKITGVLLPGPAGEQLADWAADIVDKIGDFLGALQGIDLTNPGSILTVIQQIGSGLIQAVIDALVSGLTGGNSSGNDPATLALTLLNQAVQFPGQLLEQIFGSLAALQAQLDGVQNQVTSLTDDFVTATVAGYTNIVGTLAVSSRGKYIQTPALSMGYRTTGPTTDKHGGQIVIDGMMRGTCGLAICSDTTASNYAAIQVVSGFDGDAVRLVTGSSPTVWVVQKQQDFLNPKLQNTNAFDIWYEPTPNTFHVLRNGVEIFTWVDTGNLITHNSSKRRVCVMSNGTNTALDGSWGPGIKKVTVYDK